MKCCSLLREVLQSTRLVTEYVHSKQHKVCALVDEVIMINKAVLLHVKSEFFSQCIRYYCTVYANLAQTFRVSIYCRSMD